jgi:hypothetical protein
MDTNRPKRVVVLTVIAGVLIVIDGAVLWSQGAFLNLIQPGLGNFSLFYGQTEALEGFALIALGFIIVIWPRTHLYTGLAIIAISAVSLLGGGGFIIGTPIGIAGGILGVLFVVEYYPEPEEFLPPGTVAGKLYARRSKADGSQNSGSNKQVPLLREMPP